MSLGKQHVLIIGKVWMEPGSSAAGSRTLQLAEVFLSQGWLVSFATTAAESPYKADLGALGIREYIIALNDVSFDAFIKALCPTIVVFDRFTTEEQFGWRVAANCPGALRVLDTIDLHCLRVARKKALQEKRVFGKGDLYSDTAMREIAAIYRCDLSLMISEFEMAVLESFFRVDPALTHYVPFLQDNITHANQLSWPAFADREGFVTIGNFLHEPNWDSVLFIKNKIWPLIRKKLPEAEMKVYGAYATQKVFELHDEKEKFLVKGRAESAGEVMKKARVCLAPLRFGAGMKGKLLDAMLNGTPTVTTAIGAEAMHGKLNWNGAIAENPEDLSRAAVELYTDELSWTQARENGKQIINNIFSKQTHAPILIERLQLLQQKIEEHRLNNFTGAMLMHHTISATKYMAMWIEAKNKQPFSQPGN